MAESRQSPRRRTPLLAALAGSKRSSADTGDGSDALPSTSSLAAVFLSLPAEAGPKPNRGNALLSKPALLLLGRG